MGKFVAETAPLFLDKNSKAFDCSVIGVKLKHR